MKKGFPLRHPHARFLFQNGAFLTEGRMYFHCGAQSTEDMCAGPLRLPSWYVKVWS